jgi:hypothetical protein
MIVALDDPNWGPLTVDVDTLKDKLGEATRSVYEASMAAQYRTTAGFPISSPMATILGGLSQVIDGLIDELEAVPVPSADGGAIDNGGATP